MSISIIPNENVQAVVNVPVCFEASANVVIPQEDIRYIDLPASGTNWTYENNPDGVYFTNVGPSPTSSAPAIQADPVNSLQPFHISATNWSFDTPAAPNRNFACHLGVFDESGAFWGWYLVKFCGNQSPSNCSGVSEGNSLWQAFFVANNVQTFFRTVNFKEVFRMRSDGTMLHWDWRTTANQPAPCAPGPVGPCWRLSQYSVPLPSTTNFRFHLNAWYTGNKIWWPETFRGSFVGPVATTWSAPLGGTITGEGNNRCFYAATAGNYLVCVASEYDDPVCVDVEVAELYFNPVGFDCGECVFVNQLVEFESNGGLDGVLTATAGTVIDALTWQAPATVQEVMLTYTIGGVSVGCTLHVVPEFQLVNVENEEIRGLLPGDTFQIETNYDAPEGTVTWQNLDCQNLVSPTGLLTIPPTVVGDCFGAIDCYVRGTVTEVSESFVMTNLCPNLTDGSIFIDVRIVIDPVFPTPDLGGPPYVKWKPETPEYKVIVNNFEGGCAETYIRNKVPVQKWMVRYSGLPIDDQCVPEPCCGEQEQTLEGRVAFGKSATRLDEFWNLVMGQYGFFTLIEPRTGTVYRRVRFDSQMGRDHINWKHIQERDFTLVWNPCCDGIPGGTCPHRTVPDTVFPSPPQNLATETISSSKILVTWQRAKDNVGIKGYEIEIDGGTPIDVGHTFSYLHRNLTPTSMYTYRVRAYDFSGNKSAWTAPEIGTTVIFVEEAGVQVEEVTDPVFEG
jgi:hypothetical protein